MKRLLRVLLIAGIAILTMGLIPSTPQPDSQDTVDAGKVPYYIREQIQRLASADKRVQNEALTELKKMGSEAQYFVPELLEYAETPISELIEHLSDEEAYNRTKAVEALVNKGGQGIAKLDRRNFCAIDPTMDTVMAYTYCTVFIYRTDVSSNMLAIQGQQNIFQGIVIGRLGPCCILRLREAAYATQAQYR